MTLDRDDIEAIAERVAELMGGGWVRCLDAAAIAARFGVGRAWVYAHKQELGAVPLGIGPQARLRFDVRRVDAVLEEQRRRQRPARPGRPRRVRTPRTATGLAVLTYEPTDHAGA